MSKREIKIHTPGVEPQRAVESVVEPVPVQIPTDIVDTTPAGLPAPSDVDPTTLRRPLLTSEGWLCPENIRGGGL